MKKILFSFSLLFFFVFTSAHALIFGQPGGGGLPRMTVSRYNVSYKVQRDNLGNETELVAKVPVQITTGSRPLYMFAKDIERPYNTTSFLFGRATGPLYSVFQNYSEQWDVFGTMIPQVINVNRADGVPYPFLEFAANTTYFFNVTIRANALDLPTDFYQLTMTAGPMVNSYLPRSGGQPDAEFLAHAFPLPADTYLSKFLSIGARRPWISGVQFPLSSGESIKINGMRFDANQNQVTIVVAPTSSTPILYSETVPALSSTQIALPQAFTNYVKNKFKQIATFTVEVPLVGKSNSYSVQIPPFASQTAEEKTFYKNITLWNTLGSAGGTLQASIFDAVFHLLDKVGLSEYGTAAKKAFCDSGDDNPPLPPMPPSKKGTLSCAELTQEKVKNAFPGFVILAHDLSDKRCSYSLFEEDKLTSFDTRTIDPKYDYSVVDAGNSMKKYYDGSTDDIALNQIFIEAILCNEAECNTIGNIHTTQYGGTIKSLPSTNNRVLGGYATALVKPPYNTVPDASIFTAYQTVDNILVTMKTGQELTPRYPESFFTHGFGALASTFFPSSLEKAIYDGTSPDTN